MKVLFLDIDGVMNTTKTEVLLGDSSSLQERPELYFDPLALTFIKAISKKGVKIVLSSTWRIGRVLPELQKMFSFELFSKTDWIIDGCRGDEIKRWLKNNPGVENYVILDDDKDMLPEQLDNFVHICEHEGITYKNMTKICSILGFSFSDLKVKND